MQVKIEITDNDGKRVVLEDGKLAVYTASLDAVRLALDMADLARTRVFVPVAKYQFVNFSEDDDDIFIVKDGTRLRSYCPRATAELAFAGDEHAFTDMTSSFAMEFRNAMAAGATLPPKHETTGD